MCPSPQYIAFEHLAIDLPALLIKAPRHNPSVVDVHFPAGQNPSEVSARCTSLFKSLAQYSREEIRRFC